MSLITEFMLLADVSVEFMELETTESVTTFIMSVDLIELKMSILHMQHGHIGCGLYDVMCRRFYKTANSYAAQEQANELVAEFMLLANMSVAQMIGMAFPENAMLRRHPPPQDRQLGELEAIAEKLVSPPSLSFVDFLNVNVQVISLPTKFFVCTAVL